MTDSNMCFVTHTNSFFFTTESVQCNSVSFCIQCDVTCICLYFVTIMNTCCFVYSFIFILFFFSLSKSLWNSFLILFALFECFCFTVNNVHKMQFKVLASSQQTRLEMHSDIKIHKLMCGVLQMKCKNEQIRKWNFLDWKSSTISQINWRKIQNSKIINIFNIINKKNILVTYYLKLSINNLVN